MIAKWRHLGDFWIPQNSSSGKHQNGTKSNTKSTNKGTLI